MHQLTGVRLVDSPHRLTPWQQPVVILWLGAAAAADPMRTPPLDKYVWNCAASRLNGKLDTAVGWPAPSHRCLPFSSPLTNSLTNITDPLLAHILLLGNDHRELFAATQEQPQKPDAAQSTSARHWVCWESPLYAHKLTTADIVKTAQGLVPSCGVVPELETR